MKPRIVMFSAAGALLAGAIAFAIHTHRSDSPAQPGQTLAGRSATTAQSSAAGAAPHTMSDNPSGKASHDRPRIVKDQELVAKYGESRTKLARHVTGNLLEVLADLVEMGNSVSDMRLEKSPNDEKAVPAELEKIGEKLALNDEQTGKATKIFGDHTKRELAAAGQFIDGMKSDPAPLMEVLLAGDAFKHGKMDEEEFKSLQAGVTGEIQSAMGVIGGDSATLDDPLKDKTVLRELNAVLEPGQRETLQSFLQNRPLETEETVKENEGEGSGPSMNLTDAMELEDLDQKLESAKKLSSGLKLVLEGFGGLKDIGGLSGK